MVNAARISAGIVPPELCRRDRPVTRVLLRTATAHSPSESAERVGRESWPHAGLQTRLHFALHSRLHTRGGTLGAAHSAAENR